MHLMGALDGGKGNQEITRPSLKAYLVLDMSQDYMPLGKKRSWDFQSIQEIHNQA